MAFNAEVERCKDRHLTPHHPSLEHAQVHMLDAQAEILWPQEDACKGRMHGSWGVFLAGKVHLPSGEARLDRGATRIVRAQGQR